MCILLFSTISEKDNFSWWKTSNLIFSKRQRYNRLGPQEDDDDSHQTPFRSVYPTTLDIVTISH